MGKSFNDDVFNNSVDIASINGLNISKEAIEENKEETKPKIDLSKYNLDEIKEELEQEKQKQKQKIKKDPKKGVQELLKLQEQISEQEKYNEKIEQYKLKSEQKEDKEPYVKRTLIIKQDYLDIINGLSEIKNTERKITFNQLLELGIQTYSKEHKDVIEKALKVGRKEKQKKNDSIL